MDPLTKKDLIELFSQQYDRFATEVQELRKSVEDRNDDVFQKMDQVYGELKTMRQEREVHTQEHIDLRDEINNLKSLPTITHELKHYKNSSE